jgi:YD repeat-containing protein
MLTTNQPLYATSLCVVAFIYCLFGARSVWAVQNDYDDLHRLTKTDYGNGVVIQYDYDAAGNMTSRIVQSPYSAQPQIVVQDNGTTPATTLTDGTSTVPFAKVTAGQNTVRTFTVSDLGIPNLTGLAVTVDGANAADFTVTQPTVTSLSTNASITITVLFAPTTPGSKTTSLHIANNDPNHSPFTVTITGTCPPLIESWRQTYFGTTANAGDAADSASRFQPS